MTPYRFLSGAALAGILFMGAAHAQVTVKDAWVRATVPQQRASGAFVRLESATNATLMQVSSPVAAVVELHHMSMQGDVMKMQQVAGIALPAGKTIALEPGGYHIMLMDLKQTLKAGDTVPLTLVIETADKQRHELQLKATVRALNSAHGAGKQAP
ncbi:MAG: copper chaperone PCu(A)C [Rubrivivax sp.]